MKIICIHQGADLYGSDRSFLQVIDWLVASGRFEKITVVIPRQGPLVAELEKRPVQVTIMPLSLLSKTYLKKFQFGKIIFPLFRFRQKKKLLEEHDIIYVNTCVILDFYLLAPFIKRKKFIHIREIPGNRLKKILSFLLLRTGATVIFNSLATRSSFNDIPTYKVIHNAFEGFGELQPGKVSYYSLQSRERPLKLLIIGRINNSKGQDFVLEALKKLRQQNFLLRIVGSPFPGNEHLLDNIKRLIIQNRLEEKVELIEFTNNPVEHYTWCDLILVPSKKPESFGRIAIEAMSVGKPVLASDHGGVCEIVQHGRNGYLFHPNDEKDFTYFLQKYFDNPGLLREQGKQGLAIFKNKFSMEGFYSQLAEVFPA